MVSRKFGSRASTIIIRSMPKAIPPMRWSTHPERIEEEAELHPLLFRRELSDVRNTRS